MQENPLSEGLITQKTPEPFIMVIFGASGDLAAKKLIPALYSLFEQNFISNFQIVGFARTDWDSALFRQKIVSLLKKDHESPLKKEISRDFLAKISFISAPYDADDGYVLLKNNFLKFPQVIYYLATPPIMYEPIIDRLGKNGLANSKKSITKIVVEKPFGRDLGSARLLNDSLFSIFKEEQIYRIDHYLGKETVQNIMVFRFGNGIYEPIWNHHYIDHVQITVAEKTGIEKRGSYYENAGAIRDMLQNHLLQLLCLVAMETPNDLRPDSIRNEKIKILKAIRPIAKDFGSTEVIRGQYSEGIIDGEKVNAYRKEDKVDPQSTVETYVALRLFIDTWRWSGVPFFLRSGKRLARRLSEISIQFKAPPHLLFSQVQSAPIKPNTLTFSIQPDEGITFQFNSKIPGFSTKMRAVNMAFTYGSSFASKSPEAYERLLLDILLGDPTLFARNDEVEHAWEFVSKLLPSDGDDYQKNIIFYPAGSSGPEQAQELLTPYKCRWRRL
jgi:glucose-6-phosphate 1-dehydrogenase